MLCEPFENCVVLQFVNRDILEQADRVTQLYVAIEGRNDRPVLTGLRTSFALLDNYLPPEINTGFNASFLITETEVRSNTVLYGYTAHIFLIQVMDADRVYYSDDFIGLAIINVTHGIPAGFWQYKESYDAEWINITV